MNRIAIIIRNQLSVKTIKQLLKFGTVGIINTAITLLAIYALYNFLNISYYFSNAIGFVLGFINSFVLNKIWTFKSNGSYLKEAIVFTAVFVVCYIIQLISVFFLKDIMYIQIAIAQIFGIAIYTISNFIGNKYLTFKL